MRITLGRLQAADTLAVSVAMMDPRVSGWLHTFPYPYTQLQREEGDTPPVTADWAVRADGRFVGIVLASPELGCWIDPKFQGVGIATRASVLALTRLFSGRAQYSYARYLPENQAMKAMLDRLGFRPDTSIPSSVTRPDLGLLRLCREDFYLAQPLVVQGRRIRLSPIRRSDQPVLYEIARSPEISGNLPDSCSGMSVGDFSAAMSSSADQPSLWSKICIEARIIGAIGLERRQMGNEQQMFLQGFLSPAIRDEGIGTEAIETFTRELQDRFGLACVNAECFADDSATLKMLEGAGFVRDAESIQLTMPQRSGEGYRLRLSLKS